MASATTSFPVPLFTVQQNPNPCFPNFIHEFDQMAHRLGIADYLT
jgi:hypothetical protein